MVSRVASRVRLRRARDAREILDVVEPLEPETVLIVGQMMERGLGRHTRAWVAEGVDGEIAGILLLSRICRGRWRADPVLIDESAAEPLGRLIDRSPAWEVGGASRFIEPLLPHLRRAPQPISMPLISFIEPAPPFAPQDPRSRLATEHDIEALVDLYDGYELDLMPTRPRLRRFLRETLARKPIIVIEEEGRIVAAARFESRTRHYDHWSASLVRPDYRGRGLYWILCRRAMELAFSRGVRLSGLLAPSNHAPVETTARRPAEGMRRDEWLEVQMHGPRRFRGHVRLRRSWERLEDRFDRRRHRVG